MAMDDKNRAGAERAEAKAEEKSKSCKAKQKDKPAPKAKQQRAKTAYQASVVLFKCEVLDIELRHTVLAGSTSSGVSDLFLTSHDHKNTVMSTRHLT